MSKTAKQISDTGPRSRKRMSAEAREKQLIAMAYEAAAERIQNGTASAQEITYFLKLGSSRERREQQLQEEQYKLIKAKTESILLEKEMAKETEGVLKEVIDAITSYRSNCSSSMINDDLYHATD